MMVVLCVVLALLALWLFLGPIEEPLDSGEPDDVEEPDADPPEDALDGPAVGGGTDGDQ